MEKENEERAILPSDYVKVVAHSMHLAMWISEQIERGTDFRIHRTKRAKGQVVVFLDSNVDGAEHGEPDTTEVAP
jgi:hypothetical protein